MQGLSNVGWKPGLVGQCKEGAHGSPAAAFFVLCRHVDRSFPVCDGSEQQAAGHRSVRGAMADEAELAVGGLVAVVAMTLCT